MVDKDLFLHDLSIVAILKNEGPYLKEWLDYHLLAGVEHFYLYDNESPDNQAEVAKPYVAAGLVDYIHLPGKAMQYVAYNDAVKRFKFQSRYMAFLDGDEFIYPKTGQSISVVIDEILLRDPQAAGLVINWQIFGSNGQEAANYSKGVLERFTRRAHSNWIHREIPRGNQLIKTIANPRAVNFMHNPHYPIYFKDFYSVNEKGIPVIEEFNEPVLSEKIVLNHYHTKSIEEYEQKINRGLANHASGTYTMKSFEVRNQNDEFDDGILKYRDERADNFGFESTEARLDRMIEALTATLSQFAVGKIVDNKIEVALTCRALSMYLREQFPNDAEYWQLCEKASLEAVLNSLKNISFAEAHLFLRELPNLLDLPYPVVKDLREAALNIIPQMMNVMRLNSIWKDYVELDYTKDLLKLGG